MIYSSIQTHYLSAESGDRLVRYDIIATDSDTYLVKVIDEQKSSMAEPKPLLLIDQFHVTRSDYFEHYGINVAQQAITFNLPPSFEDYLLLYCQRHRNKYV
ncbi:hypothetical protein AAIG33_00115 [Phytobacter ursingii]|uniref:hypothetical protein n=1 Tax=Phytobacter ursingii TaxID=1972431 RepID=UPI000DB31FDC|nr:MAG: hypothetical protein DI539_25540 [Flavobacterium psychrophilum]RDT53035.1 hypothetical protein DXF93_19010 [Escherichia coli]